MSLVHNEQTKLTATFVNGVGLAVFAVGGLGPLLAALTGAADPNPLQLIVGSLCVPIAGTLHLLGRLVLRRLVP